ncbi:MAG: MFS transporter [Emcibacteraceae bacterium]|nr:MFS transporter [Emcibacteraceae bacterium]
MIPSRYGVTKGTHLAFSSGGAGYGIVYNAHYFVLFYYSQVMGLDPGLAGLAVSIGLIFDAISDPLIGYLSDNTRSKWGRLHPWMLASILPLAVAFYFLWHPPEFIASELWLFTWLVICNVSIRTALTLFLVPAYAMVAEITADYDQRTGLLTGFHVAFGIFANGMSLLLYAFFLVPTDEITDGVMNPEGYQNGGLLGAILIVITLLVFCYGLRRFIPKLKEYQVDKSPSLGQFFHQFTDVFKDIDARIVLSGGIIYYIGVGTYNVLWVYMYSHFWEFTNEQVAIVGIPMAVASIFLPPLMAKLAAGREKKTVAIIGIFGAMLINVVPICLYLLGFFPEGGSDWLLYIMVVAGFFETILFLVFDICWRSMIVDLTEQTELKTGRRNEGVIASSITFAGKCADAFGTLIGGLLLSLIAFPTETAVGDVPHDIIVKLGLIYGPLVFLIWMGVIITLSRYRISRKIHEETLKKLADR